VVDTGRPYDGWAALAQEAGRACGRIDDDLDSTDRKAPA